MAAEVVLGGFQLEIPETTVQMPAVLVVGEEREGPL